MESPRLTDEQKKLLWEFENWLMANKIGWPNDGRSIPIDEEFDEKTMMVYHIKEFDRIFIVKLNEIPRRFLRAI